MTPGDRSSSSFRNGVFQRTLFHLRSSRRLDIPSFTGGLAKCKLRAAQAALLTDCAKTRAALTMNTAEIALDPSEIANGSGAARSARLLQ